MKPHKTLPLAPLHLGRLIASLPEDVNRKLSLHDLDRITKAYNTGPCPNCYGGHFKPCQWCGDTGVLTLAGDRPEEEKNEAMKTTDKDEILSIGNECEACQGTGKITEHNPIVTDAHTKWQRTAYELVTVECPVCNGAGKEPTE